MTRDYSELVGSTNTNIRKTIPKLLKSDWKKEKLTGKKIFSTQAAFGSRFPFAKKGINNSANFCRDCLPPTLSLSVFGHSRDG